MVLTLFEQNFLVVVSKWGFPSLLESRQDFVRFCTTNAKKTNNYQMYTIGISV